MDIHNCIVVMDVHNSIMDFDNCIMGKHGWVIMDLKT